MSGITQVLKMSGIYSFTIFSLVISGICMSVFWDKSEKN